MNNLNIVGRVGKDAVVRDAGRTKVTSFSIAWTSPFGEKKSTWFNVSLFGDRFEKLSGYIKKGDQIGVTGSVELREYTTKEGEVRQTLEINGNDVTLLGSRNSSGGNSNASDVADDEAVPF